MIADHFDLVKILSIRDQAQTLEGLQQAFVCMSVPSASLLSLCVFFLMTELESCE